MKLNQTKLKPKESLKDRLLVGSFFFNVLLLMKYLSHRNQKNMEVINQTSIEGVE